MGTDARGNPIRPTPGRRWRGGPTDRRGNPIIVDTFTHHHRDHWGGPTTIEDTFTTTTVPATPTPRWRGPTDARGNPITRRRWQGPTDARGNPITRHIWDHHHRWTTPTPHWRHYTTTTTSRKIYTEDWMEEERRFWSRHWRNRRTTTTPWRRYHRTTTTTTTTPTIIVEEMTTWTDHWPARSAIIPDETGMFTTPTLRPTPSWNRGRHSTVRPSEPRPAKVCWARKARACIKNSNIGAKRRGKTLKECKRLCARVQSCKAIEFYHNYGGSRRTFRRGDCQLNFKLSTWKCDGTRHNMDVYYPITCRHNPTPEPSRRPPPNAKCVSLANRIQTKGCYDTRVPFKRGKLLIYWRHKIDWKNISLFASKLACACSQAAKRAGAKYFGLHYWGGCWALARSEIKMANQNGDCTLAYGKYKTKCTGQWNMPWKQECLGVKSYFVYKILARGEKPEHGIMA